LTIGIEGREKQLGTGKTAFLVGLGYRAYCDGVRVASNFHLKFDYIPVSSVQQLNLLEDCLVLLDEGWSWIRSRSGGSDLNMVMNNILLSSRKRNCSIYYTQQVDTLMDRPVREITAEWIETYVSDRVYPNLDSGLPRYRFVTGHYLRTNLKLRFAFVDIGDLYDTTEEVARVVKDTDYYKQDILSLRSDDLFMEMMDVNDRVGMIQHIRNNFPVIRDDAIYMIALVRSKKLWR